MNAKWSIETVEAGMNLVYENVVDNIKFECGVSDAHTDINDMIAFVLDEGGQIGDCVYLDGRLVCEILLNEVVDGARILSN